MTLLAPAGLTALIAVPGVLMLWLLHARFRSLQVPSLVLWQTVAAPVQPTRSWRLPPLELLLVLDVLIAAALGLAWSRPALDLPSGRHVALVLDASVSMQAQDVAPSRFEAARQQLLELLTGAAPADRFSVVWAGAQPRFLTRDGMANAARAMVDSARADEAVADLSTALRIAGAPGIDEVVVATDGATPLALPAQKAPVTFRLVGGQADQLALSDVSVRLPIDGSQNLAGFASVVNYGSAPRSTQVEVVADGVLVDSQPVTIAPRARTELTFRVPLDTRSLRVMLTETDVQPVDKRLDLTGPVQSARTLTVVSDRQELWNRVLASTPLLTVRSVPPSEYQPPPAPGIVLLDGWLPPDLPDVERILVNPPDRAGVLVRHGAEVRTLEVEDVDYDDPVAHTLDLSNLVVTVNGRAEVPEWSSLTLGTTDDFIGGHGWLQGRRTVVLAWDPFASNLPSTAAFPVLVSNAIDWLVAGRGEVSHVGLGRGADITPHALQDLPSRADAVRSPVWLDLAPYLTGLGLTLVLIEVVVLWRRGGASRVAMALLTGTGLALTVTLLQPGVWLAGPAKTVVLAVDRSASVAQASVDEWLRAARSARPAEDRVAMVTFGRDSEVVQAPSDTVPDSPPGVVDAEATDIGLALRTAAGLARNPDSSRIVLISDGRATTGDLEGAVRSLGGIPVDAVPVDARPQGPAVVLESLDAPQYVRVGDLFDATLGIAATESGSTPIVARVDDQLAQTKQVALSVGHQRLALSLTLREQGFHRLSISANGKTIEAPVTVKPAERVLVIEERPGESAGFLASVRGAPGTFDVRPPAAVTGLSQLEPYDAVVLANVSATSFTLDQQRSLQSFVVDRGRGLVALGGSTSFVLGDYEGSVLEQILPVRSFIPPRREGARMALLLVIDISQSMDRVVEGVSGIDMAKQAAILSSRALRDDDQVGVLIFNHRYSWLQPIGVVKDIGRASLEERIASLSASGGTEIFAALNEGAKAMEAVGADLRHIVLFTDGNSRDANYDGLTAQLRVEHIGLSTVGLGPEADTKLLAKLAKDGEGRFYFGDRPSQLPRILTTEVAIAKRSSVVEGTIQPALVAPSPILRGIAPAEVPPLSGYISTTPRTQAQVILATEDQQPLLAQWHIGLGRAVAWTSDVGGPWTGGWSEWSRGANLWQQTVAWAAGVPVQPDFLVSIVQSGASVQVQLDEVKDDQFVDLASPVASISGPPGTHVSLPLRQSAPGQYTVALVSDQPGTYAVTVSDGSRTETKGFAVRADPEQQSFGADEQVLRRITSESGGRVLVSATEAFRAVGNGLGQHWQPLAPLLQALGLVLFVVGVAARRVGSSLSRSRRAPQQ
jgi:uncharacterized membrane protein/Mg-chelatase subunit ChlD